MAKRDTGGSADTPPPGEPLDDPRLYEDLKRIAARELDRERRSSTFSTSDLVNAACLKLEASSPDQARSSELVRAVAARAVRQLLIDRARYRDSGNRMPLAPVDLDVLPLAVPPSQEQIVLVHELFALVGRKVSPRAEAVLEERFFAGMSFAEIAVVW